MAMFCLQTKKIVLRGRRAEQNRNIHLGRFAPFKLVRETSPSRMYEL